MYLRKRLMTRSCGLGFEALGQAGCKANTSRWSRTARNSGFVLAPDERRNKARETLPLCRGRINPRP